MKTGLRCWLHAMAGPALLLLESACHGHCSPSLWNRGGSQGEPGVGYGLRNRPYYCCKDAPKSPRNARAIGILDVLSSTLLGRAWARAKGPRDPFLFPCGNPRTGFSSVASGYFILSRATPLPPALRLRPLRTLWSLKRLPEPAGYPPVPPADTSPRERGPRTGL